MATRVPAGIPSSVTHVLFDVDGTLVDFVGAMRIALRAAAAHASNALGKAITADALMATRDQVAADPAWQGQTWAAIRRESMRRVAAPAGERAGTLADELVALYRRQREEAMAVYPDVEETLAALSGSRTLVAASNGNVDLATVGLDRYFTATHYAEAVGVAKPDPRFFALAAEIHDVDPASTLVVGDRIDNDYEPARLAGMHAIVIDRAGRIEDAAVPRIGRLTELVELLQH